MTRRKSRPLLSHEVISLRASQESVDNATSSTYSIDDSSQQTLNSSQSSVDQVQLSPEIIHETSNAHGVSVKGEVAARTLMDPDASFKQNGSSQSGAVTVMKVQGSSLPTVHAKRGPGYLANRRSAPFAICQDHHADVQSATVGGVLDRSSHPNNATLGLKRTPSLIRLSTSLDGKAQITTGNRSLPQIPPLPASTGNSRHRSGLLRTQSAIEPTNISSAYPRRSVTGRSRDARTWEFYCEGDTRDALTEQAEREQSGSAIGPISLIRSRSNKAMAQNTNKRNAMNSKHEPTKRQKPDGQPTDKPKLARASSSIARLQSVSGNVQKQVTKTKGKADKPPAGSTVDDYYSGDSDKENWLPGTRISNSRSRRANNLHASNQAQRAVLEESQHVPSRSSSLEALMNSENLTPRRSRQKQVNCGQGATAPKLDDEVTAFMGQASEPSEEPEDLDCVQHLLSLSKAAWQ